VPLVLCVSDCSPLSVTHGQSQSRPHYSAIWSTIWSAQPAADYAAEPSAIRTAFETALSAAHNAAHGPTYESNRTAFGTAFGAAYQTAYRTAHLATHHLAEQASVLVADHSTDEDPECRTVCASYAVSVSEPYRKSHGKVRIGR
jgi:hypothetical protein